jgi:hypothetical protein
VRKLLVTLGLVATLGGCVVADPVVVGPAPYYPPPPPAYYYPPPAYYYGPPAFGFSFNYRSGPRYGHNHHHRGYRRW